MYSFDSKSVTCKPLTCLNDLVNWSGEPPFEICQEDSVCRREVSVNCRKFNVEKLKDAYRNATDSVIDKVLPKIMICHDMNNNYLEDRYMQGYNLPGGYKFFHWNLIDYFIYFSHNFITIPPESWINAAHENNCRILGTFITEFDNGELICQEFLPDKKILDTLVKKLVDITVFYGFDGWLLNIENKIEHVDALVYFVDKLRTSLREIDDKLYTVIWYDSVLKTGELNWQNELNELNECYFDKADSIFLNYCWKDRNLANSRARAMERLRLDDVYVGVDVFGRGCFGGGGFNTNLAFEKIAEYNLNYALFAPAWVYECNDASKFIQNNEKFWSLLSSFIYKHEILELPLITSFSSGSGKQFYLDGNRIQAGNSNKDESEGWNNLNLQGLLPVLFDRTGQSHASWCFEDAFYAGNCIQLNKETKSLNLFKLNLKMKAHGLVQVDYVFKMHFDPEVQTEKAENGLLSFWLTIVFQRADQSALEEFNLAEGHSQLSKAIEVLNYKQIYFRSKWVRRSFTLKMNQDLTLKELNAVQHAIPDLAANEDHQIETKLGFLKMIKLEHQEPFEVIKTDFKAEYETKLFRLNGDVYLCLKLKWESTCQTPIKYYNLFISDRTSSEENTADGDPVKGLVYVGSTRVDSYSICLKLDRSDNKIEFNQNKLFESVSLDIYKKKPLSFSIYIQHVDELLEACLAESSHESMARTDIMIPCIEVARDAKNLKYFDRIIYDFECFNF